MTTHLSTQDRPLEERSLHCVCEQKQEERTDLPLQRLLRSATFLFIYLLNNQRDATLSIRLYYSLRNYSTCFVCSLHPSSGVH
jgi:hypothetical protein